MARKRRKFSAEFKHRVALEAVSERKTLTELAQDYDLHPNQIVQWKKVLQQDGQSLFQRKNKTTDDDHSELIERLYQQIGQLQFELNWLKKKSGHGA